MSKGLNVRFEDTLDKNPYTNFPDVHQDTFSKTVQGFWLYLMTDCLLFATLFCTYAVLHQSTFDGPGGAQLFKLSTALFETLVLLFSSVTCGFAMLAAVRNNKTQLLLWLGVTFILGACFLATELHEFAEFIQEGNSWRRSAFLSAFFTLVSTHGIHITIGLLWLAVMIGQVIYQGINKNTFRRLIVFSMFWHFLDLVWIFIFTFVYLGELI